MNNTDEGVGMKALKLISLVFTLAILTISCDSQKLLIQANSLESTRFCLDGGPGNSASVASEILIGDDNDDSETVILNNIVNNLIDYGVSEYEICDSDVEVIATSTGYEVHNIVGECDGFESYVKTVIKTDFIGNIQSEEISKVEGDGWCEPVWSGPHLEN